MPYQIRPEMLKELGDGLTNYYQRAWLHGIHAKFDVIARHNMGLFPAWFDQASDAFAALREPSRERFSDTVQKAVAMEITAAFGNSADVARYLVAAAATALNKLSVVATVPGLSQVINFAAETAEGQLREHSVTLSDRTLAEKSGMPAVKMWTTEENAAKAVKESIDHYVLICNFIRTLPQAISTYDEAIRFPESVFKVQAAASSLNVQLYSLRQFLAAMQDRLQLVQGLSTEFIAKVRTGMPAAVNAVLQNGYTAAYQKGQSQPRNPTSPKGPPPLPVKEALVRLKSADEELAIYLAHALKQGYWEGRR